MNEPISTPPRRKRPPNKAAQIGAGVGMIVGIVVFNIVGPKLLPPPEGGGFNWMMVVWTALIGGIAAGFGAIIGAVVGGPPHKK